ncbi:hypothetical protein N7508_008104 [Penicillium antarcticum]|uniref:uncharacterized protein n=1 Tax=Penicillium antarcticum TaxID=416450 RepID=UPI00239E855A|nr:uncharacterized protein N7508_008104 [Penicillium antarcticum]KAJ5297855.1 hypothetical protein N7508_008104 [Penicillium antarcticum]
MLVPSMFIFCPTGEPLLEQSSRRGAVRWVTVTFTAEEEKLADIMLMQIMEQACRSERAIITLSPMDHDGLDCLSLPVYGSNLSEKEIRWLASHNAWLRYKDILDGLVRLDRDRIFGSETTMTCGY